MPERERPLQNRISPASSERAVIVRKAVEMMSRLREEARQRADILLGALEAEEISSLPLKKTVEEEKRDLHEKSRQLYESQNHPTFASEVSRVYFAQWDAVELQGNSELKPHLRVALLEAEQNNDLIYRQKAEQLGLTPAEYKDLLQRKVEEMVAGSHFFTAVDPEVLSRILRLDGRWKTQFETTRSGGTLSPHRRAGAELLMFGFNIAELDRVPGSIDEISVRTLPSSVFTVDQDYRPVYGYMSDHEHGFVSRSGTVQTPCVMRPYGKVHVRLRRESVLPRATVTFHDSLTPSAEWPPSPAAKPHFASVDLRWVAPYFFSPEFRSGKNDWGADYLEVQYHGQLRAEDIESVHVSPTAFLTADEIADVKKIVGGYNDDHLDQQIQLMEYTE